MITQKRKREELQLLSQEALDAYMNRPDFQYDANGDALYRHYKDQYTELGKRAMQDTMGQAAALTGGYGSSYAQSVGQQAYQSYLFRVDDVLPELYQLAYQKYQDEGNRLYKTYQSWSQLEQQAAQQEQWEREYELEERKRQDANRRFEQEQEQENSQTQTVIYQPDYWASLAHYHKLGQNNQSKETAEEPEYDNGKVSEGNIKTMQRVLGLEETGKWTDEDRTGAGGLTADKAWEYYQKGQLQNYKSVGLGLDIGNIKTMERVLGLEEDGYWSEEDQKAAGGLTAYAAWKDYQQGKLQSRSRSGMSMEEWADLKKKQSSSSNASNTKENTPAVQNFISGMVMEDQAAEQGVNSTEWKMMVVDRLNRVNMTMNEFEQLEKYYGLDIPGSSSAIPQGNTANHAAQKMSYAEYRQKTAVQKVSNLNAAVQKFFNTYQLFVNSAVYDIQNVGYKNAASMLEDRVRTAKELQKEADTLASALRMNTDIISGDFSDLLAQIVSTKTGIDSIMDAFGGQVKYYSNWETEEDYNESVQAQKEYESMLALDLDVAEREVKVLEDLLAEYDQLILRQSTADPASDANVRLREIRNQYGSKADLKDLISEKRAYLNRAKRLQEGIQFASVVNNDDFEYYSALGAAIQNPSIADAEGYFNFFGWRPGSEEVGNIVTYSRANYANIAAMSEGGKYDVVGDLRYKDMTDDEVAIYNYLLAKEGKERAGEFLSYIEEDLNARGGKRTADLITSINIPVVEELATGLYGLGAGIDQWISGTRQLFTNEQLPISIAQYANSEIADSLDGFGKNLYTGANVIGNMAPSILLSYVTAGLGAPAAVAQGVGAAAVGMSAAGNAYGSALRDGYSIGQARAYSTLVGAAEGTLQYILGGISSLGGVTDDLIKAKINMIDNSLLRISAKLGVNVFSEVTEEELQNFLEPAFRSIIFGEEYDAPTIDEMLETAIVTAGTTLLLGGGDTVSGDLSENRQFVESGQKIMGIDGGLDTLMNSANEVLGLSSAQMQSTLMSQIDNVSQNPTARNVGQLNATAQAANNQANATVNQASAVGKPVNTVATQTNTVTTQEAVAQQLISKGLYSKKADSIADAIVARLNGQELTRTQKYILSSALNSSAVRDTISEFIIKKVAEVDSEQNRIYDRGDIGDGPTDEGKAALWDLAYQRAGRDRSGGPGVLREIGSMPPETFSSAQRRGLTSEVDVFGDNDYATVMGGSSLYQVRNAFSKRNYESGTDVLDEIKRTGEIVVEFNYNSKYGKIEFARQLADQQKGMKELTVQEYLDNRRKYIEQGRATGSNAAQQAAREKAFADKVDELQDAGLSLKEAEEQAKKWLDTQATLHIPDQVAGGYSGNVGGVGDKGVNSSIGAQWRYRISGVDAQIQKMAESMSEAEKNTTYLNVNLIFKGE